MSLFARLFSINPSEVQRHCVLLPFINKTIQSALGHPKISRGQLYGVGQTDRFSFIRTGMGTTFLGDAVLYLQESPVEVLTLFGACGAMPGTGIGIGDVVTVDKCLALESFSEILNGQLKSYYETYPDFGLLKNFEKTTAQKVKTVTAATFASLKLESAHQQFFQDHGVQVVDMECSAFFEAARSIKRKATAIFFVTDMIGSDSLFAHANSKDGLLIDKAITQGVNLIKGIRIQSPSA